MTEHRVATVARPAEYAEPALLEFPGCRPVRISRKEIADCDRRIEYWDATTEIAMVCEPVSIYHEHPGQRLRELLTLIAQTRGSPIGTLGAADLLMRDAHGAYLRILEADQTVYLHPRATRPAGPAIEVGSDVLPDVVLEVDNTTDVRRGKLSLYESWGFPGGLGRGAGRVVAEPPAGTAAGLDDPRAGGWRLSHGAEQPGVSGVDGAGDSPRAERGRAVGRHDGGAAPNRADAGCGEGHGS